MKISSIKAYTYKSNSKITTKKPLTSFKGFGLCDFFELGYATFEKSYFENKGEKLRDFLFMKGKVTKDDYLKIKENNPELIEEAKEYIQKKLSQDGENSSYYKLNSTPDSIVETAEFFKQKFDEKYPKKNYKIISIGTSPAILAQTLSYLGCEVDFIPASNLNMIDCLPVNDFLNIKLYKLYPNLKPLGNLFKESTSDKDKHYIIIDYVNSGRTFEVLKELFERMKIFPNRNYELFKINRLNRDEFKLTDNDYTRDCFTSNIKYVSNVPHFDVINNLNNIRAEHVEYEGSLDILKAKIHDYSQPLARAYNLCILDIIEKKSKAKALD